MANSQCLWPGCDVYPANMGVHMKLVHGVTPNKNPAPEVIQAPHVTVAVLDAINPLPGRVLGQRGAGSAVRCKECDIAARIIEQRNDRDGNCRRRRECPQCFTRFTTYEIRFEDE